MTELPADDNPQSERNDLPIYSFHDYDEIRGENFRCRDCKPMVVEHVGGKTPIHCPSVHGPMMPRGKSIAWTCGGTPEDWSVPEMTLFFSLCRNSEGIGTVHYYKSREVELKDAFADAYVFWQPSEDNTNRHWFVKNRGTKTIKFKVRIRNYENSALIGSMTYGPYQLAAGSPAMFMGGEFSGTMTSRYSIEDAMYV